MGARAAPMREEANAGEVRSSNVFMGFSYSLLIVRVLEK